MCPGCSAIVGGGPRICLLWGRRRCGHGAGSSVGPRSQGVSFFSCGTWCLWAPPSPPPLSPDSSLFSGQSSQAPRREKTLGTFPGQSSEACRAGSARSSPSGRRSPARPPPEALRRRRERRGEAALTCLCRAGLTCREFDFGVWPQVGLGKRRAREKSPRVAGAAAPGLSARGTPPSSVLYLLGSGSRRPAMTCTWPLGPWAAA